MENNFNFEIFETPKISDEEIEIKTKNKELKREQKNKKNLTIKIIGSAAAALILTAIIFCGYLFTSSAHNPDKLVKSYINKIENADWKSIYSKINFENSALIDEKQFINFCKENPEALLLTTEKIIDFEIEKDKISDDEAAIYYSINYIAESGSNGTLYLEAVKTNDKSGILSTYGIIPTQSCFCSLTVTAPPKTEVKIGSKLLENPETQNGNQIFKIKYALPQSIDITAKNEFCNDFQTTANLDKKYNSINICPELSKDCFIDLCGKTKDYITFFYTGIINNSEDYSQLPLEKTYKENGFEEDINNIKNDVYFGNYTISNFTVTEATLQKTYDYHNKELNQEGKNEIEIKYNFKYSYTFTYNDEAGNPVSIDKTENGYMGIRYILTDQWYINDINSDAWF